MIKPRINKLQPHDVHPPRAAQRIVARLRGPQSISYPESRAPSSENKASPFAFERCLPSDIENLVTILLETSL